MKKLCTCGNQIKRWSTKFCSRSCYYKSRIGTNISKEHKEAISKSNKGWKPTSEQLANMSKANKGRVSWNTGKKLPLEIRKNMSAGKLKGREPYSKVHVLVRRSQKYRNWRDSVFKRDDFTCQLCWKRGMTLNADHFPKSFASIIKEFGIKNAFEADKCKELWDMGNARTLCVKCHKKTPTWGKHRKYHDPEKKKELEESLNYKK